MRMLGRPAHLNQSVVSFRHYRGVKKFLDKAKVSFSAAETQLSAFDARIAKLWPQQDLSTTADVHFVRPCELGNVQPIPDRVENPEPVNHE